MVDTLLVTVAVTAGLIALVGVPLRAWQFHAGRFRSEIPRHALARATFSVFAVLFLVPNLVVWAYTVYTAHVDFTCLEACEVARVRTTITIGMLGCAYALLEGFLFTARRRVASNAFFDFACSNQPEQKSNPNSLPCTPAIPF